jgi:hypothetical protein
MRTLFVFVSAALAASTSSAARADTTTCNINAKMVLALSIVKKDQPEKTKADLMGIVRMTNEAISPAPMTALEALSAMGVINFVMEHTEDKPRSAAATFFQECMAAAGAR